MADYISRQKAIEAIMDLPNCPNGYSDTYDKACIIGMLEEVPTADVVEVVRCKDCQHWCVHERLNIPWCREMHIDRGAEDFCSMAKRRDDGSEL